MRVLMLIPATVIAAGILMGCPAEEPRPAAPTEPDATRDTGQVAAEASVTGEVKARLLADTEVGALMIDVDTVQGTVFLVGVVDTEEQRMRAEEIAREAAGHEYEIENHLEVRPPETR